MAVRDRQFSKQNISFLENNRSLSKFLYGVLHYLISIIKLQKKLVHKTQLYIKIFLITIKRSIKFKTDNYKHYYIGTLL